MIIVGVVFDSEEEVIELDFYFYSLKNGFLVCWFCSRGFVCGMLGGSFVEW